MSGEDNKKSAFFAVTILFFAWGFITSMLDPLVAAVKGVFTLSTFEAQASAFAFFFAYFVFSFPAAAIISRIRSVPSILMALVMMAAACLVMLVAANVASYPLVLIGLFVLAGGITILQVAANPLAAALGDPAGSHFRLTLSQAFNSFGTFLGPWLGAELFLKGVEVKEGMVVTEAVRASALAGIDKAYFYIFGLLLLLTAFFWFQRRIVANAAPAPATALNFGRLVGDSLRSPWALFGAFAIFLYVGAEVSIGTQLAFLLNSDGIWGISVQDAGKAVAFYWGGAMVGRMLGSLLLARFPAGWLLVLYTAAAAMMCAFVAMVGGVGAGYVALAIGLFNSIMFPVIFTLTLERTTASVEATSGLLCTGIVGGAIMPLVTGHVADAMHDYAASFVVPLACYVVLLGFASQAVKTPARRAPLTASLH